MTVPPPDFLTVAEAAVILRVSHMTVRRRIVEGELPAHRIGGSINAPIRIDRVDLYRYLRQTRSGR